MFSIRSLLIIVMTIFKHSRSSNGYNLKQFIKNWKMSSSNQKRQIRDKPTLIAIPPTVQPETNSSRNRRPNWNHNNASSSANRQQSDNYRNNYRNNNWRREQESINSQSRLVMNPVAFEQLAGNRFNSWQFVSPIPIFYPSQPQYPGHVLYHNGMQNVQANLNSQYFRSEHSFSRHQNRGNNGPDKRKLFPERAWEPICSSKCGPPGFNFSVMSYNVLAQDLVESHKILYRLHKPNAIEWGTRWGNIRREIEKLKPDIFCLQEVQESHVTDYFAFFETLGYKGLFKKRTSDKTDGCAIYYKSSAVNLVDHDLLEFNIPKVPILNRDNVAIIAKFSPKTNPTKHFVIATTHLLYNPRREDIRLAQVQVLLASVERMSFKEVVNNTNVYVPIILTGDFNSPPQSAPYNLITRSELVYENLTKSPSKVYGKTLIPPSVNITDNCQHTNVLDYRSESQHSRGESSLAFSSGILSHNFVFKSVYSHIQEGTTFQDRWLTVDYIFYSGKKDKTPGDDKLKLTSRYNLPRTNQLIDVRIPNEICGSDHISLLAKFKLMY